MTTCPRARAREWSGFSAPSPPPARGRLACFFSRRTFRGRQPPRSRGAARARAPTAPTFGPAQTQIDRFIFIHYQAGAREGEGLAAFTPRAPSLRSHHGPFPSRSPSTLGTPSPVKHTRQGTLKGALFYSTKSVQKTKPKTGSKKNTLYSFGGRKKHKHAAAARAREKKTANQKGRKGVGCCFCFMVCFGRGVFGWGRGYGFFQGCVCVCAGGR